MKRIIALLLTIVLTISMTGCSSETEKSNNNTKVNNSSTTNNDSGDRKNTNYTLYDDLPNYEKIPFHETYISTPAWRSDETNFGWRLTDSTNYVIVITHNFEEDKYNGKTEDILDETYNAFTDAVGDHAVTNEFGEYNLTTKKKVTLDCGSEAMKFEGTMSANEYSAIVDYYIYGYSFVYDKSTITIGASVVNPDVINEKKDMLKKIVDKMVKTIRTQP